MRNLEDCKAEVFRRSEERIKERKRNRNCVLACCIPLCLLLVVGSVTVLPKLLSPVDELWKTNAEDTAMPDRVLGGLDGMLTESEVSGSTAYYTSVEITDRTGAAEVSRKITDKTTLGTLSGFMIMSDGAEKDETTVGKDIDASIEDELRVKYGLEDEAADYKLVFRSSTGEELVFRLYGKVLFNDRTDCTVTLSDVQFSALKEQLEQAVGKGNKK